MTSPHTTHTKPTPSIVCTRLRKHYPDVYNALISDYRPLQHPFSLIDDLYSATDDSILFFASVLLLYGRYGDPLTMPRNRLHHGTGKHLVRVTGLLLPNVSTSLSQAAVYFRVPDYKEHVKQFVFDTVGISL